MSKLSKSAVDAALREVVFDDLMSCTEGESTLTYIKVNDRQYGVLLTDANGTQRYCRVGVIVAEEREDMSAQELMDKEIADYNAAQERKAERARKAAEKKAKDAATRAKPKDDEEGSEE